MIGVINDVSRDGYVGHIRVNGGIVFVAVYMEAWIVHKPGLAMHIKRLKIKIYL